MLGVEKAELAADSKYRAYVNSVEKTLKLFEDPNEWADLITALGKLCKVLHSFSRFKSVPKSITVSKRLSQCLHPSLPSGVHLKALECYRKIFELLGVDGLACDLNLFSVGLYPLMPNASINVKKALFDIYEKHFISLGAKLTPGLSGFLCGVLPALEEGSEFYDRTMNMMNQVCDAVGLEEFYSALWNCVTFSSHTRLPALVYVMNKFDRHSAFSDQKFIMGHNLEEMIEALCCAAKDDSPLVQRHLLDFLYMAIPLNSSFLDQKYLRRILGNAVFILLKRDVSLNRRLYTWVLGKQKIGLDDQFSYFHEVTFRLLTDAIEEMLGSVSFVPECVKILRLLTFLLDKPEIGRPILENLLFSCLRVIMKFGRSPSKGSAIDAELLKSLNILLGTLEPGFIWTYLQQRLSDVSYGFPKDELSGVADHERKIVELCDMQRFFLRTTAAMPSSSLSLQRFADVVYSYLCLMVDRVDVMTAVPAAFDALIELVTAICNYIMDTKLSPDRTVGDADPRQLLRLFGRVRESPSENERLCFHRCCDILLTLASAQLERKATISKICRLVRLLVGFCVYFYPEIAETPMHVGVVKEIGDMKGLIALSQSDVSEVAFDALEAILYMAHLTYKAVGEEQQGQLPQTSSSDASVLRPFVDLVALSCFYRSIFVEDTCRCLWRHMSCGFVAFRAACLFVWLHSLCRLSLCEDFLINEMTSNDEERRNVALQNFVLLWTALREGNDLLLVRDVAFKPLLRATDVMLHGLVPTFSCGQICRQWFADVLEHGDVHILLQMMCLELTRSDTFRVAPRFLVCSKKAVDDTAVRRLFELTTRTMYHLFHWDGTEPCFTSKWAVAFRQKYFQERSIEFVKCLDQVRHHGAGAVKSSSTESGTELNEPPSYVDDVVRTVLEDLSDYVEDVCQFKDCRADRVSFDYIVPEYLQFCTLAEYRRSNVKNICNMLRLGSRSNFAQNRGMPVLHPVHADWLIYYEVFDCSRIRHVFDLLIGLMDSCPAFFIDVLLYQPIVLPMVSYQQLIGILTEAFVRHEKALYGCERFHCVTDQKRNGRVVTLPLVYIEIFITYSLSYVRSFYLNSPLSQVSEQQLRNNLSLKILCLNFLAKCFRQITVLLKKFGGRSLANHVMNVFLSSRLQKRLMRCFTACVVDDGLLSRTADARSDKDGALLSVSILHFNFSKVASLISEYRESLVVAIEALVETEHALRKCASCAETSHTLSDSLLHSAFPADCYVPLTEKKCFVATVVYGLRTDQRLHPLWLKLVIHCAPYLSGSFPLLPLAAMEQSFLNVEIAASVCMHCCEEALDTLSDIPTVTQTRMPWNYISTVLELVSKLFRQCILSNRSLPSPASIGDRDFISEAVESRVTAGEIISAFFRVFRFSGILTQSEYSQAKSIENTNFLYSSGQRLLAAFPRLLEALCSMYAAGKTSSTSPQWQSFLQRLPDQIVRFLVPFAQNHDRELLCSFALIWSSHAIGDNQYRYSTEQRNMVDLVISLTSPPIPGVLNSIIRTLKQSARVKTNFKMGPVQVEVPLLEMAHCIFLKLTSATPSSCSWPMTRQFLTDALSLSSFPDSKFLLFKIFACFLNQLSPDDSSFRKELQDMFQKLVDILTDIIGWQLNQSTWLKKTLVVIQDTEQDHNLTVPGLRQSQSVGNVSALSASSDRRYNAEYSQEALELLAMHFVTMMDIVYRSEDKEKQTHLINCVWTVILPFLKTRHISNSKNFLSCCQLLVGLSRVYLMKSLWRKHVVELIVDPSFFCMDVACFLQWSVIVANVLSQDRMIFKEIMNKLAPLQNIFTSKEQEYDMRRSCLKRLSFLLFSGELDEYQGALPDIQERITDDLKVTSVPSVYSCVFLCFRVIIIRFSAFNLMSFWPSIITELMQVLLQLEEHVRVTNMHLEDCRPDVDVPWLRAYLSATKLLEALFVIPAEKLRQFQMYRWIFTEVAYDATSCNFSPFILRVKNAFEEFMECFMKRSSERESSSVLQLKRITNIVELAPFYLGLSCRDRLLTTESDADRLARIESSVCTDLLEDWLV